MASWTSYKGLQVPDSFSPPGNAGEELTDDLTALADRAPFRSTSNPTVNDDSGDQFFAGSLWLNTSTQTIWLCTSASAGAAKWRPIYARIDNAIVLVPEAGVGGGSDNRAIQVDTGGNARGTNAVDLQYTRSASTQVASGDYSMVRGKNCTASGGYSTANVFSSIASGTCSTASGTYATASSYSSTASGYFSTASDYFSTAKGRLCTASNDYSIATGYNSNATGYFSISKGYVCTASGRFSTVSGYHCTASGDYSIVNGAFSNASAFCSVANGSGSCATGVFSIAYGNVPIADKQGQHTIGAGQINAVTGAQRSSLQWTGRTTNNTQTEIYLNGDSGTPSRATVPANRVWSGHIEFSGIKTDQSKGIVGMKFFSIRRDGSNNTSLIGSITDIITTIDFGTSGYSISIDADDTNESLRIRVTGATSETVNWTATAYFAELPTA